MSALLLAAYLTSYQGLVRWQILPCHQVGRGHRYCYTLALGYGLGTQGLSASRLLTLGVLAIGCGMFKPACSTLLALLYPSGDPAKVKAMGRYYLAAITKAGSLPAPLLGVATTTLDEGSLLSSDARRILALFFALLAWRRLVPYKSILRHRYEHQLALSQSPERWQLGATCNVANRWVLLFWAAKPAARVNPTFWAAEHVDRVTRWGLFRRRHSPV